MVEVFANGARGRLLSGITAGATSLTLRSGQGAAFPAYGTNDYSWATLEQGPAGTPTKREIVKVTARASDTLTITRAQQSTTALAFDKGTRVELRLTATTMSDLQDARGFNRRFPMGGVHPEGTATADGYGSIGSSPNPSAFSKPTPTLTGLGASLPRVTGTRYIANSLLPHQNTLGSTGVVGGYGGTEFLMLIEIDNNLLGTRKILGMSNSNNSNLINAANPSTLTGTALLCIGQEDTTAAAGNWQVYINAGTGGPVTVTDTGIAKVIGHLYQMRLWSPRGVAKWFVEVIDYDAHTRYFGSFTSNLPAASVTLLPTFLSFRSSGTDNFSIVGLWVFTW